jgi:predicted MPP superfamily phosphohydrolase
VKGKIIFSTFVAVILIVGFYGFWIEPYQIEINHLYPANPSLKKVLAGKTALHISDLHLTALPDQGEKLIEIIKELKPDFVFLTGDYVPWKDSYEPALDFLAKLEAKFGVWAVMGDYDYSNDRKSCLFCHDPGTGQPTKRHRVKFLRNSIEQVSIEGGTLQITGVEYESDSRTVEVPGSLPNRISMEASIILSHSPLVFDELAEDEGVLALAGDTHGGQLWLPNWLWSLMGYEKNAKYSQGLFKKGNNQMYVSKGLGTSHVRFRLMCRPEIAVLHF